MLAKADVDIKKISRFFSLRNISVSFLVPTETGMNKSIMDAHMDLCRYLKRTGIHDFSGQAKGPDSKVTIVTKILSDDKLLETTTSLYRPITKSGDPRLWIYNLRKYARPHNLLALIAHGGELFVINVSVSVNLRSLDDPNSPINCLFGKHPVSQIIPSSDRFCEWNIRLLKGFFNEASNNEEVFLRVDKEYLDQIGQDIGGDAGFLKAVKLGPAWLGNNLSFVKKIIRLKDLRVNNLPGYQEPGKIALEYQGCNAPAYLPYLAAFVRNYTENGHAYYDGLKNELDILEAFGPQEMRMIEPVWQDLQEWTENWKGKFGYFKLRRLGGYHRLSIAKSQSILNSSDIEKLPRVFAQAELQPGHELTASQSARVLEEARASSSVFSNGFREALNQEYFEVPIISVFRSAYSEWDGTLPQKRGQTGQNRDGDVTREEQTNNIALYILKRSPLTITPAWLVAPENEFGDFKLTFNGVCWKGRFYGTTMVATSVARELEVAFWDALQSNEIVATYAYGQSESSESISKELKIKSKPLWVLTMFHSHTSEFIELREAELPAFGPAYILVPPASRNSFEQYLERERPSYQHIVPEGLPSDWQLVCFTECGNLSDEQRILPDGRVVRSSKPRSIRFEGGKSVRRGYIKLYLPYDLPEIIFDAPEDAFIRVPKGIKLIESENDFSLLNLKPPRRFRIEIQTRESASFELLAISGNGGLLGSAKLRVASFSGDLVKTEKDLLMDSLGRIRDTDIGMSGPNLVGIEIEPATLPSGYSILLEREDVLGRKVSDQPIEHSGLRQFLDALAQVASMTYGQAKELLYRLTAKDGQSEPPLFLLFKLRSMGHLDISISYKGHIERIIAVTPTIYSLGFSVNNKTVWALSGTLRLDHWEAVAREKLAWSPYQKDSHAKSMDTFYLLIHDHADALQTCHDMGFTFSEQPALTTIEWSANLADFRSETFRNPIESLGTRQDVAQRFTANRGIFSATPAGEFCELWKIQDLDTYYDNLYVMAENQQYAFVSDSRWGVWLAVDSFAGWLKQKFPMEEFYPFPIMYQAERATLWIPARIGLPVILDKAAVLCSGCSPDVYKLSKIEEKCNSTVLGLAEESTPILEVDKFYDQMADGQWLAYKLVSRYVAEQIAEKLGARLSITKCVKRN